ncbi:twitch domain-containing radical SAM protein [Bacteriovorax sp. PP10]|uniref:Twitch domain-containing radical SAM protein n=1 Tax=Bacteriovorax antarcticus TaxID=3088717 RepID=A0ABU5VPM1_9BACT|nr:twitch domain-containing radical SAM protein [Bacteriovorax sp. PP10]MEA9354985.1 twitch domain-containing radical SAM protein [Bacteriovorax sp. PP10]
MNKKFCPVPWSYVALKNNGDFRVCCHANASDERGLLRKTDQTKFNIATDSISHARQSQLMSEVRLSMLNNETHSTCIRCDKEDLAGMHSRRQYEKERAASVLSLEQARALTNADGSLQLEKTPVRFMDLRFSNRCNLKCRMCGPTDSEFWYDDYVKVWQQTMFTDGGEEVQLSQNSKGKWIAETQQYKWVDEDNSWSEIKANLSELEYIYIVGGEPLLVMGHVEILRECIARNVAGNITLEYNTNLTLLPDEVLELWKHFKKVRVGISIDGVKKVNDYIRSPSKWEQIEFNFKKLMDYNLNDNFEVWFSLTYQAYNAYHIVEVFEWIKNEFLMPKNSSFYKVKLKTHPLHKPDHLSVKILPRKNKDELALIYKNYIQKLEEERKAYVTSKRFNKFVDTTTATLNSFLSFMEDEDLSSHLDTFLRFTKDLDSMRSENISTVIPEIGKMIHG